MVMIRKDAKMQELQPKLTLCNEFMSRVSVGALGAGLESSAMAAFLFTLIGSEVDDRKEC